MHRDAARDEVGGGAGDRDRVHVGGVHDRAGHVVRDHGGDGARSAAQVDDGRGIHLPRRVDGGPGQALGASARHEDPGSHDDPPPRERRPTEDDLEGRPVDAGRRHPLELVGAVRSPVAGAGVGLAVRRLRDEQRGLLLGEHAAGRPQARDDVVIEAVAGRPMPAQMSSVARRCSSSAAARRRSSPCTGGRACLAACSSHSARAVRTPRRSARPPSERCR